MVEEAGFLVLYGLLAWRAHYSMTKGGLGARETRPRKHVTAWLCAGLWPFTVLTIGILLVFFANRFTTEGTEP